MRQQAQKRGVEMPITASQAYSNPTGKCRRKIPPLAKNEVMDTAKGARTSNLQGTRLWRVRVYLESFRRISWAKLAVWRHV